MNGAVFALMSRRRITSATLMPGGPFLDEAVRAAESFSECSFGVHLTLTEFSSVSGDERIAPLLDEEGRFRKPLRTGSLNREVMEGIYQEWEAQIQKIRDLGIRISHVDSHHSVHQRFRFLPVLKRLLRQFKIRKVRIRSTLYPVPRSSSFALRARNRLWNRMAKNWLGASTTQGFAEFLPFFEIAKRGRLKANPVEAAVHPGAPAYADETSLLETDWQEMLPFSIQLISYNDL